MDSHKNINEFEVREKLGSGAFGQVYKVMDIKQNVIKAIKEDHEK